MTSHSTPVLELRVRTYSREKEEATRHTRKEGLWSRALDFFMEIVYHFKKKKLRFLVCFLGNIFAMFVLGQIMQLIFSYKCSEHSDEHVKPNNVQ